jgi:hypothetical protein
MKYRRRPLIVAIVLIATVLFIFARLPGRPIDPPSNCWHSGDILFLDGTSIRSRLVRLAEGYSTDYSHVGIIVLEDGVPFVVHADPAAGMVIKQRLDIVLSSGQFCGGALYRIKPNHGAVIRAACATANLWAQEKLPFNSQFDLESRDRLYCTELVWRAYLSGGIDLCDGMATKHRYLLPAQLLASPELRYVVRF